MPKLIPEELPDALKEDLQDRIRPILNEMVDVIIFPDTRDTIKDNLVLWIGEDRRRSALMGENLRPSTNYPDSAILLHIDAIVFCAKALGDYESSRMAFSMFLEIGRWLRLRNRGYDYVITERDEDRALSFTNKSCRTLVNKDIIPALPKDIINDEDAAMRYLNWLRDWTKMEPSEWGKYLMSL